MAGFVHSLIGRCIWHGGGGGRNNVQFVHARQYVYQLESEHEQKVKPALC